ncbi:protein FATTY ACID EXPORT 1, chloroplastic isoform X1 [Brassica rapa]|uniref:protein FATTY ACID EXPORT 1, chloroplastic isoform X1 n=1 Tax=Brassica campestris TaxID=3711 RepID=UPI00142E50CD|nr:protein FATTY ACID EXPORT 1, chloroplastic isoform X1 [Brassica rapa]
MTSVFGIPYGGLVMSGGLLGFAFSRNLTSLSTGVLYGGALLALSTLSMKIWRQGKSSFPYILGQAVLSAVVFWKNFTTYSMVFRYLCDYAADCLALCLLACLQLLNVLLMQTKKLFPAGLFAVVSAAMLCFYSYVVLSGGNPPPKKLKPSASPSYRRNFHKL